MDRTPDRAPRVEADHERRAWAVTGSVLAAGVAAAGAAFAAACFAMAVRRWR